MPYLAAAVALVGLLCTLNLLLTVGVIRRLRAVAANQPAERPGFLDGLAIGKAVPDFTATTIDGEPISRDLLGAPALIGFFSPGCPPCEQVLPRFVERARERPDEVTLAVIVASTAEQAAEDIGSLAGAARVVVEEPDGALQRAFEARGFPTVYVVGADGTVAANNPATASLVVA